MALEFAGSFVLSDSSLDAQSSRVLVKGMDLKRFKKNPVMFYNHRRTGRYKEIPELPIGIWKNIKKDGDQLKADAYLDTDDDLGLQVYNKIQSKVLRATSIGASVLAISDDTKDKVLGQRNYTITKSELLEASIVDIPSNPNALIIKKDFLNKTEEEQEEILKEKLYHSYGFLYSEIIIDKNNSDMNILKKLFGNDVTEDEIEKMTSDEVTTKFMEGLEASITKSVEAAIKTQTEGIVKSVTESVEKSLDEKIEKGIGEKMKDVVTKEELKAVSDESAALKEENEALKKALEDIGKDAKDIASEVAKIQGKETPSTGGGTADVKDVNKQFEDDLAKDYSEMNQEEFDAAFD